MATVHSLVCWGGRLGKTVSISATTDVVTLTGHGNRNGSKRWPSGTLPPELNVFTPVYTRSTGANTFTLHTSEAGAIDGTGQIVFSGSSTYAAVVLKSDFIVDTANLAAYGVDISRYGSPGSERIYDGLISDIAARATTSLNADDEVFEIGESFDEISSSGVTTSGFGAFSLKITSSINGARTDAFHNGIPNTGYRFLCSSTSAYAFTYNSYFVDVDGIELAYNSASASPYAVVATGSTGYYSELRNCIINNVGGGNIYGIRVDSSFEVHHNLIINHKGSALGGIYIAVGLGASVYNNTVSKCDVGIRSAVGAQGLVYNNLSVLNTVNWTGSPAFNAFRAGGNIGTSADTCTFTATAATQNLTTSVTTPVLANSRVWLTTTGTLPTVGGVALRTDIPYYVNSIVGTTVKLTTVYNGSALTFDGVGTGTHTLHWVWATATPPGNYIDTSDPTLVFADFTNNDFRPAGTGPTPAAQAKMVDAAVTVTGLYTASDMVGAEVPNYNNGGAEGVDVGCLEYNHGYGPHPASHTLTLTNVVVGSRVFIRDQANTTTHYDQIAASSTVEITVPVYGDSRDNWRIKIRKASAAPYYQSYETLMTATAGSSSIYVNQLPN